MPTELRAGNSLHDLSADDIRFLLAEQHARELAHAGNVKRMELTVPVSGTVTSLFVSQTSFIGTPDEGYVWSLKLITCTLSGAGTFAAFKASSTGDQRRLLGVTTGVTVGASTLAELTWSSDQAELKHGEGVFLLSGVNITNVYMVGEQTTAEKAAQIYD